MSNYVSLFFSAEELVFKDQWGGISLLHASNLSIKTLMYNQTYVSIDLSCFAILIRNEFPVRPMPEVDDHPYLLLAMWAPRGHGLVMVQDYDIYYRPSPTSHIGYRITKTAVPGVVSHGVPDWLYEGYQILTQRVSGDGKGWVDMGDSPLFGTDSSNYITVAPVRDGPAGYFRHAISVNIPKRRVLPLTHGKFEISRILAWDHSNDVIYFLGIPEGKPGQQHLYRMTSVPPRAGAALQPPICLTCVAEPAPTTASFYLYEHEFIMRNRPKPDDWTEEEEDEFTTPLPRRKKKKTMEVQTEPPCLYHNAIFSPITATYYILECLGPGIPMSSLYRASIPTPKLLLVMQNNSLLRERVEKMAMPQIKTFPVRISGGYQAHVRLHLPPGLREEEITRYPLVVQVYGGPGSQLVTERWRVDWNTFLASNKDLIIAQIDGRGSGGQGHQFLHKVYYKLGSVEVADQLEVTEYLKDTLHYIDKRRIAVWGWSYGGFVAALALASPRNVFHCAIAVAPVTNWKLYDSAYTERYMGFPNVTDNYKGYDEADVSKKADLLKDKMFYLVHGTADDNVHLQQSMALVKALSEAGTLFRQQIYPDESHGLGGVKKHLYRSMGQFLDDCFRKQVPPEFKAGLRNDME
ncbi:protease family s9bc dipeptidyl-peptidase iv-related [Holotrichia oblita]|uniref:Protease family s9bc dipeptidyl-peptidase iv-related n=1 Tax=Holotrichia oblita TaxID=644536 RepID=A0ACB9TPC3_HOLOL|nr:protease family s9bc dipeptidyl-peptidase iv-related [Holotrichia oblita]